MSCRIELVLSDCETAEVVLGGMLVESDERLQFVSIGNDAGYLYWQMVGIGDFDRVEEGS